MIYFIVNVLIQLQKLSSDETSLIRQTLDYNQYKLFCFMLVNHCILFQA